MTDEQHGLSKDVLRELEGSEGHFRLLGWLLTHKDFRQPKTYLELANEIGVGRQTLYNWRDNTHFQSLWRREAAKLAGGIERTQALLDALYETGVDREDKRHVQAADRFIRYTQAIAPSDTQRQTVDLGKLSLAELEQMLTDAVSKEIASRVETA